MSSVIEHEILSKGATFAPIRQYATVRDVADGRRLSFTEETNRPPVRGRQKRTRALS